MAAAAQVVSDEKPETTVKIFNSSAVACPDVIWSEHLRLVALGQSAGLHSLHTQRILIKALLTLGS